MFVFPEDPLDGAFHRMEDGSYFRYRADPPSWYRFHGELPIEILPLTEAKEQLRTTLQTACKEAILGGFTFKVNGLQTTYGSSASDQINYISAAVGGGHLWYNAGAGWTLQYHSPEDASQVVQEFSRHRSMCSLALSIVDDAIEVAKTTEALSEISYLDTLADIQSGKIPL